MKNNFFQSANTETTEKKIESSSNSQKQGATGQKDSFLLQPPQLDLPKGGGAIRSIDEKFKVNAVNGTASFSLPLPFSSARDFSPALSLNYNSGSGNGVFGLGWSLSLPSIKRKTENELPQYNDTADSDTFVLSGAEDLVPEFKRDVNDELLTDADGNYIINEFDFPFQTITYRVRRYRPRIEGLFSRIERWTDKATNIIHWRVITSNNITTIYGRSDTAKIYHPIEQKNIFEWLPEFMYDDKGNCAVYEYKKEDAVGIDATKLHNKNRTNGNAPFTNVYVKRIRYGNTTPFKTHTDPVPAQFMFETVFDYGEHDAVNLPFNETNAWSFRNDAFSAYRAGFEVRTCRLCQRVLLYHHFAELSGGSALIKSLQFDYANNNAEGFTFLSAVTQTGYTKHDDGTYTQKSFPPFTFDYQKHEWNDAIQTIEPKDLLGAPAGIDNATYQLIDLYNEGLPGILTEQANAWFYKNNLGNGHFEETKQVMPKPNFTGLPTHLQLMELEANGERQVVQWHNEPKGFFELNDDDEWQPFRAFEQMPTIDFNDSNTRLLDLNGDGQADILITEQDVICWYPSKGKQGFAAPQKIVNAFDEEKAPVVVFANREQAIFLADMNGDGLTDIVRIRNGEVCYWPQLGHGKFGAKVNMDNAPIFDSEDQFHPTFIKLADIDGSGTTDIIYHGKNQFRVWLNQHGNRFSTEPKTITTLPELDNLSLISVTDLLGNGMACIVWNNSLPKNQQAPLRYINLLNNKKPHLMVGYQNNLGKEVLFEYTPSTQFYLDDKAAGHPWVTKLHFPVHCVSKVTVYDRIQKTRFASEYSYHHGYYDHAEKEFRGFGRVDQKDAEDIAHFVLQSNGMNNNIVEQDLHQPPVLTKSWFHTGAFVNQKKITNQFESEYFQNNFITENLLSDTELPDGLSSDDVPEALRACKGMLLRKEVYALDDDATKKKLPYAVEQHNCLVKMIQPKGKNKFGVFLSHESETIKYEYERNPEDPRIAHSFVMDMDNWGNVLQTASVAYPRKPQPDIQPEQQTMHIVYTENSYTKDVQDPLDYRKPMLHFTKAYHVTGIAQPVDYFLLQDLKTACNNATVIDYDVQPNAGVQKRLIDFKRTQYRNNDGTAVLSFGDLQSKGLVHQSYQAVFNQNILATVFGAKIPLADLQAALTDVAKGAYVFADNYFWIPSGTRHYDTNHFYLSTQFTNPFGKNIQVEYDNNYSLFITKITDAVGNETNVNGFNYRVLSPYIMQDANDNLTATRFDELGMVVRSFLIGKKGIDQGDEMDDTKVEMKDAADFPSAQLEYNIFEWYNQSLAVGFDSNNYKPHPNFVKSKVRETHYNAEPLHQTNFQESYTYSDGAGNVLLTKNQAKPGAALQVNDDGTVTTIPDTSPNLRWVGNGRSILNNKGNAVKKYEPYFSTSPSFDDEKEMVYLGVTPVIHYDPLGRAVRTDYANKTFNKTEFTPWLQKIYDANDTVKDSEWYATLGSPDPLGAEPLQADVRAAWLAAQHDDTPALAHIDNLGRKFLTVLDNGTEKISTKLIYDIEGNEKEIWDGLGRKVMEYQYAMNSIKLKQTSTDAGSRWMMSDAAGKLLFSWDDRNHQFTFTYDDVQRPLTSVVKKQNETTVLYNQIVYGEGVVNDKSNNLRGVIYKHYDQSGIVTNETYDFKGKITKSNRQLTKEYNIDIDWANPPTIDLDTEIFENSFEYDAIKRPIKIVAPHLVASPANEIYPIYNQSGFLDKVDVKLSNAANTTAFVTNINYNAKGQREEIFYGNNTTTKYTYEKETFHLKRLLTTRNAGATVLQDLNYTHDPVGNITTIKDDAQPTIVFDNETVQPINQYSYNALYQLTKATGRKQAGQTDINHQRNDFNYSHHPFIPSNTIDPNDAQAFRNYREEYSYDKAGNMLEQKHIAKNSSWTRDFEYNNANNFLTKTTLGAFEFTYTYDAHGNLQLMEHLQEMDWSFLDQLQGVDLGGGGTAYYVYDASGQRVRKVIERINGDKQERLYLGGFEIYREKANVGNVTLSRETLHIMDNQQRIAMIDTPLVKPANSNEIQTIRYQYDNHLGSASLELDEAAQIISYEEYFSFGTTSYSTIDAAREVAAKRYRYTGKERDEESGLNYHGARYYIPWLCRWSAADPAGIKAGMNLYVYVSNNPILKTDSTGKYEEAGHYYTTYLAAYAAGYTEQEAFDAAVYSQMPDEVSSLDATKSSIQFFISVGYTGISLGLIAGIGALSNSLAATSPFMVLFGLSFAFMIVSNEKVHNVSEGLHSLSGRSTTEEWDKRVKQFKDYEGDPVAQGLVIHALGDTPAHSEGSSDHMAGEQYGTYFGHGAAPRTHDYGDRNAPIEMHETDRIYNRPGLHADYMHNLIGVLASGKGRKRRLSAGAEKAMIDELKQRLSAVKDEKDDKKREKKERQIFEEVAKKHLGLTISEYRPEDHDDSTMGSFSESIDEGLRKDREKHKQGAVLHNPTAGMTEEKMMDITRKIFKDSR